MNTPLVPVRAAKLIGAGVMAAALLAATAGCSAGDSKAVAPAASPTGMSADASPSTAAKAPLSAKLVRVIDGETIEVQPVSAKNGQPTGEPNVKVHMLGTSAPQAPACGAAEAAAHLQGMMQPNEPVDVTYEPTLGDATDKGGNILAYATTTGGVRVDLGGRMISEGYAAASYPEGKTPPNDFKQYDSDSKSAQAHKKGLWAACPTLGS